MPPTISAVIATRQRPAECAKCVASLVEQTTRVLEVVVIEADGDGELQRRLVELTEKHSEIIYVCATQRGLVHQRNQGVAIARGDVVFLTDDDTVLERDCIEQLVRGYEELGAGAAGIQPTVLQARHERGSLRLRRLFMLTSLVRSSPRMQLSGWPLYSFEPTRACRADVFCGVNSYRREVFRRFKFDERLSGYASMEDADFSYRVSRAYPLWVWPPARVWHYPAPEGRERLDERHAMAVKHHWYLFRKNMPKRPLNLLAFAWANLGNLGLALVNSLRWRTPLPTAGVVKGLARSVAEIALGRAAPDHPTARIGQ